MMATYDVQEVLWAATRSDCYGDSYGKIEKSFDASHGWSGFLAVAMELQENNQHLSSMRPEIGKYVQVRIYVHLVGQYLLADFVQKVLNLFGLPAILSREDCIGIRFQPAINKQVHCVAP